MKPNKLSKTAAYVAVKFYGITLKDPYRSLFEDEVTDFYGDVVKHLPFPHSRFHDGLQKEWLRSTFMSLEEKILPGDLMHIVLRKYCMGHLVRDLVKKGYRQMIVLGAGFDHLAVYHSVRGIHCVELDAPRMASLKSSFVNSTGYNNEKLTIVPAYFTRDKLSFVLEVLTDIDPSQKTIIVAEGFFDYLSRDQVKQLLGDITHYLSGQIALASTVFALEELKESKANIYKTSVWLAGERLRLNHSLAEFTSLLMDYNFDIEKHLAGTEMHYKHLRPLDISLPVLSGFHLLQAVHNGQ